MSTVLGGRAEFERELIRARTGEGRERTKTKGVKLGREPKYTPHQQREAVKRHDRNGETLRLKMRELHSSLAKAAFKPAEQVIAATQGTINGPTK